MKIQVVNVTPKKQGVKNGKAWTISEVETVEGEKYDTFDSFDVGEYEVTVTPNENPKYNANIKKTKGDSPYVAQKQAAVATKIIEKNDDKEQRITMLSCLSSACNYYQQRQGTEDMVLTFAKRMFHEAMHHGTDKVPF